MALCGSAPDAFASDSQLKAVCAKGGTPQGRRWVPHHLKQAQKTGSGPKQATEADCTLNSLTPSQPGFLLRAQALELAAVNDDLVGVVRADHVVAQSPASGCSPVALQLPVEEFHDPTAGHVGIAHVGNELHRGDHAGREIAAFIGKRVPHCYRNHEPVPGVIGPVVLIHADHIVVARIDGLGQLEAMGRAVVVAVLAADLYQHRRPGQVDVLRSGLGRRDAQG